MHLSKYLNIAVISIVLLLLAGCVENRRKPLQIVKSSRQLGGKIHSDSSDNTIIETIYITDSNSVTVKIDVTEKMKNALVKLMENAVALNYSEKIDRILQNKDYELAERLLLAELDKIARDCGFPDFRSANRIIEKIKEYPEIASLMDRLEEFESSKYKNQVQ